MRDKVLSPLLFLAAVSFFTPPVEATYTKWPGASCTLRLTSTAGLIQDSDSGTSSAQGMLSLSIQNDTLYSLEYSASFRCTLPPTSATLGPQGIVSYLVNHPD